MASPVLVRPVPTSALEIRPDGPRPSPVARRLLEGGRQPGRRRPLAARLDEALAEPTGDALDALHDAGPLEPVDERDALGALLAVHDLWMAPLAVTRGREVHQGHPVVAEVKRRLEARYLAALDARLPDDEDLPDDAVAAMRRIAAADLVPEVYEWLADESTWDELVQFLAIEGGPDAGFDDLVAIAQVGIRGGPKVALGANYWDEMGRGDLDDVHTVLHDRLVAATEMPRLPHADLPVSALERIAMGGVLATNRHLQPEMLGSLGLVELQAGPRCRAVVRAMRRLGAPEGALPFYEEHATADPRHGKEWLDEVVAPLAADPEWATRMVTGARWRQAVNRRFFAEVHALVAGDGPDARGDDAPGGAPARS